MSSPEVKKLAEAKDLFDSIICLGVEGVEFYPAAKILDSVLNEAKKGYDLCKEAITKATKEPR